MTRSKNDLHAGLLALASLCVPAVAQACPVCFAARDEAERIALISTTAFMTALPVFMIGGLVYWIARRARQLDSEPPSTLETGAEEPDVPDREVIPLRRA